MRNRPNSVLVVLLRGVCGLIFVAGLAGGTTGCDKVTSENVQLWKTTEKGPAKLAQAVRDGHVSPELRAEAALALLDLGQWEDVLAAWTALPPETRSALAAAALPQVTTAMKSPAPEKALLFRDFAVFIRPDLAPASQTALDNDMLLVLKEDLKVGRVRNGHVTVEKILSTLGTPAWNQVADLLAEPVVAYPALADLIGKGAEAGTRERAGKLLVTRAKAQAHPVPELWRSLGILGGPSVTAFLVEKLKSASSGREDAVSAARVLVEHPQPDALGPALKIAGDTHADKSLRDECFGVVEAVGGPTAIAGLIGVLRSSSEPKVRYRAFEAALGAGKEKILAEALDAFPASPPLPHGVTYQRTDVEDFLVNLIVKLGAAARAPLIKALSSASPLTRMTAVLSLERVGKADDAPALDARAQDSGKVVGFAPNETVGAEAARVSALLKKKP